MKEIVSIESDHILANGERIEITNEILDFARSIINQDCIAIHKRNATESEFEQCLPDTLKFLAAMGLFLQDRFIKYQIANKYLNAQKTMGLSEYEEFERKNPPPPGLSTIIGVIQKVEGEIEGENNRIRKTASAGGKAKSKTPTKLQIEIERLYFLLEQKTNPRNLTGIIVRKIELNPDFEGGVSRTRVAEIIKRIKKRNTA